MPAEFLDAGFRHVLNAISDGVYVTSAEREIVFWSQGAERITGYSAEEVAGKHCYDDLLVHTDASGRDLCIDGCPLQDCIEHGIEHSISELFLKRKDGERLPVYVKTAVFEEGGHKYGVEVFGKLESVAGKDLAAYVQELTDSSVADPLTGLFNRRYFDATLEQHFALFGRMGRRYGLLYLDIDRFKAINDSLGHSVGDEALVFVSDIITSSARKMDISARYGGDEFVVICAVAADQELESYAQRLVGLVRKSRFGPVAGSDLRLTVSVGGSLVSESDADERSALGRADHAMYRAKEAGRDGVAIETSA